MIRMRSPGMIAAGVVKEEEAGAEFATGETPAAGFEARGLKAAAGFEARGFETAVGFEAAVGLKKEGLKRPGREEMARRRSLLSPSGVAASRD